MISNSYIQLNGFHKRKVHKNLKIHKNKIYRLIGTYCEDDKIYYTDINYNIWRETEVKQVLTLAEMKDKYIEHLL